MTIADSVRYQCDIIIKELKKTPGCDSAAYIFWEKIREILPPFFQQLSEAGLTSNEYIASMTADIVDKSFNHKCFSSIQPIEENPFDWLIDDIEMGKTGPEVISELKNRYFNKEFDGYTITNKRCSSVYYNPYTMTYHDLELADGYYNDLAGIGWMGNPYDHAFAKAIIPNIYDAIHMNRFNFNTAIGEFPYTPKTHHNSLPVTWEEESVWDLLEILENIGKYTGDEYTRMPVKHYYMESFCAHMIFIHYSGKCEHNTYVLYLIPLKDKGGNYSFITHMMPYTLPYSLTESDIDKVIKSHTDFMTSYLFGDKIRYLYQFRSSMNLFELEDNKNKMWTFFVPGCEVFTKSLPNNAIHISNDFMYLPNDFADDFSYAHIHYESNADSVYKCDYNEISSREGIDHIVGLPDDVKDRIRTVYDIIDKHDDRCAARSMEIGIRK